MYLLFLALISLCLNGCVHDDAMISAPQTNLLTLEDDCLDLADKKQLREALSYNKLSIYDGKELDGYRLEIHRLEHKSRDLYSNQGEHVLYMSFQTDLEASLIDRQRGETIWRKVFTHQSKVIPNEHFYSDRNWAEAKLCYDQQRQVFSQLIDLLKQKIM